MVPTTRSTMVVQQPPGTRLFNLLEDISPRTWWGWFLFQDKGPYSHFDWEGLREGLLGLSFPLITYCLLIAVFSKNNIHVNAFPILASPWSCLCLYRGLVSPLTDVWNNRFQMKQVLASPPTQDALNVLRQRVHDKRAIRQRRYDVYFPDSKESISSNSNRDHDDQLILFIPGAAVDHAAYAPVAAQLSDAGYMVVVASMEPSRLAYSFFNANRHSMSRILLQVEQRYSKTKKQQPTKVMVMGHSLGSFAAMAMCHELETYYGMNVCGLVMWATAWLPDHGTDLSTSSTPVLLIQAEKDLFVDSFKDNKETFLKLFPTQQSFEYQTIKGGCHGGFGSYVAQMKETSDIISAEEQQSLACQSTIRFLQEKSQVTMTN